MTEVSQLTGNDCLRACLASILELPGEQLPTPPKDLAVGNAWDDYVGTLRGAVRRLTGCELLIMDSKQGDFVPSGYSIGAWPSPSGKANVLHAVVCYNGDPVWDPSPIYREAGYAYTDPPRDWTIFQALNPAGVAR